MVLILHRWLLAFTWLLAAVPHSIPSQETGSSPSGDRNGAVSESPEELSNLVGELSRQRESPVHFRFNLLDPILDPWNDGWKWVDEELNLNVGFAHTVLYQAATQGNYKGPSSGGAGDLDIFGTWYAFNTDQHTGWLNGGTFGFHFEQRHTLDGMPPSELGDSIGSLWGTTTGFNQQDFSLIQWWWQQKFAGERLWVRAGKLDLASIFDVYRFNSANHYYLDAAFSDNPAIPFPENGLAVTGGWDPTENWFLEYGVADAEGRKTATINTGNIEALMSVATIGWNGEVAGLGKGLYQVTGWNADRRERSEKPSASGLSIIAQQELGNGWVPFARYAWSDAAAVDVKNLITAGAVLEGFGRWKNDRLGIAAGWGEPHDQRLRDQWTAEIFYRMELAPELRITPHAQIIVNPSRNLEDDVIGIFGVRGRFTF